MCREPIAPDAPCLQAVSLATPTQDWEEEEEVHISKAIRHWQREMAQLLQQQRDKGGLIDTTAKDQVIDEAWVRQLDIFPLRSNFGLYILQVRPVNTANEANQRPEDGDENSHGRW